MEDENVVHHTTDNIYSATAYQTYFLWKEDDPEVNVDTWRDMDCITLDHTTAIESSPGKEGAHARSYKKPLCVRLTLMVCGGLLLLSHFLTVALVFMLIGDNLRQAAVERELLIETTVLPDQYAPRLDRLLEVPSGSPEASVNRVKATVRRRFADDIVWYCDGDWLYLKETNSCYLAITNHGNFEEAQQECRSIGAEIASIHSQRENEFVGGLVSTYNTITSRKKDEQTLMTSDMAWIGLESHTSEEFEWSDSSSVNYRNWALFEPTSEEKEEKHCVQMFVDYFDETDCDEFDVPCGDYIYKWKNVRCDTRMRTAVCKKPKPENLRLSYT